MFMSVCLVVLGNRIGNVILVRRTNAQKIETFVQIWNVKSNVIDAYGLPKRIGLISNFERKKQAWMSCRVVVNSNTTQQNQELTWKPGTILTYDHECKTNTKEKGHEITWFLPTCLNAYSWGAKFSVHRWAGNGGPNSRLDVAPSRNGKVGGGGFIHREGPPVLPAFKQQAEPVTFKRAVKLMNPTTIESHYLICFTCTEKEKPKSSNAAYTTMNTLSTFVMFRY